MSLREYQKKRDFQRTPEPAGRVAKVTGRSFVVQKHQARNLHYDFRLELDGTLKSWAVPKGPSLDPRVKRLAMQVEDHPVEYGSFEGIIPQGEYGGGTVMVWDLGTWEPVGDAEEGYRNGRMKFRLDGKKLQGGWMLVRTGRTGQYGTGKRRWLLFKERDEFARGADDGDILEESPLSAKSGRSLEEIATRHERVWSSNSSGDGKRRASRAAASGKRKSRKKSAGERTRFLRAPQVAARAGRLLAEALRDYDARRQEFAGVRLTSPEKLLYPEEGITKLELSAYYRQVSDWMLPHLIDRPLVLVRCPEGMHRECFYQKHPRPGTPENLRQIPIRESGKTEKYVVVDDVQGLVSLAQIGALEIHAWGSRADNLERPDRLIFDLDPDPTVSWNRVVESARQVRRLLQEIGLESFVKTTGGKGLHLVVPIDRRHDWDQAKEFCRLVADVIVRFDPEHYTAKMSKAQRTGKIYVDYLRNARGATAIVPYSPRKRPGAPVSVPLAWQELSSQIHSEHYTVRTVLTRLERLRSDPWKELPKTRQSLAWPLKRLRPLFEG